ncbi:MAG: DinB family protein [Candidatus Acidiferrales bacterium]
MVDSRIPEPWLRGTHTDIAPVQRAVLHALELAKEDLEKWCGRLTAEELNARPSHLVPVAFHIRHIARSVDRLLTYAEGRELNPKQMAALKSELNAGATHDELFAELSAGLAAGAERIQAFRPQQLEESLTVGTKRLPTTVTGLLVHIADHTQRHTGQAITTAKIVSAEKP